MILGNLLQSRVERETSKRAAHFEKRLQQQQQRERLEAEGLETVLEAARLEAEGLDAERSKAEYLVADQVASRRTHEEQVDEREPVSDGEPPSASHHGTGVNPGQVSGVQLDERISAYSYGAGHDRDVEIRELLHDATRGPRYTFLKLRH